MYMGVSKSVVFKSNDMERCNLLTSLFEFVGTASSAVKHSVHCGLDNGAY